MTEFKKFRVGDFFKINTGSLVPKKLLKQNPGNTPRISVTTENNGIIGYYDDQVDIPNIRYYRNFISINFFGNVFYHPEKASVEMKVHVLQLKSGQEYTESVALYLVSALSQVFDNGTYNYGNQLSSSKLKTKPFYILLPVTPSGDPDFAYMTRYIQDLEAQRIQDLDAYLKVSGLDNTTLTDQEKTALTKKVEWKKFRIDDVFDVNNTASILKSQIISNSGNTPYVTASGQNNGVQTYISSGNLPLEKGPCLMIGGKTFIVTYQSADFVSNDSHNLVLRLKDQSYATEKVYLYLISVIKAYGQERFTWNDAVTKKRLRKGQIALPVTSTGTIDFAYMQDYITALEKLNIKDVVAYKDKVIAATKQIVSQQS